MNGEPKVWIRKRTMKDGKTRYDLRWICPTEHRWKSRKVKGGGRKQAEREAAQLEDKLMTGAYVALRKATWADFAKEHIALIEGGAHKAIMQRTLDEFADVVQPKRLSDVTYATIERYAHHCHEAGNNTSTVNKKLRYIRVTLNRAVKRGYLARSPMTGWEWQRETQRLPRVLTAGEQGKLLAACTDKQWRTFVYIALTTGCRRAELLNLEWSRVDFENAQLAITGTKAKQDRVQPLSAEGVRLLRALQPATLKDGGPFKSINANSAPKVFKKLVDAAGIPPCTIHDLRRTFCTDLARVGVNQLVVQKLAGHSSATTTAKYYQLADDAMKRDAIERLTATKAG